MSEVVRTGDNIELDLGLEFKETGLFVKVTLEDFQGNEISGSPITLTELGNGRYFDDSIIKAPGSINALFEVYKDVGLTDKSDFENTGERYIDPPFNNLPEGIGEVTLVVGDSEIDVLVEDNDIIVLAGEAEDILLKIEDEDIELLVESDDIVIVVTEE